MFGYISNKLNDLYNIAYVCWYVGSKNTGSSLSPVYPPKNKTMISKQLQ